MFRFGAFELDVTSHELRKNGIRIRLQGKPFQLLLTLLERAGSVVTREECHHILWSGDAFGEFDHNLNNAINKLRRALNDSASSPRYIETLPRIGYRFVAPVDRQFPAAEAAKTPAPPIQPKKRFTFRWQIAAVAMLVSCVIVTIFGYRYYRSFPQSFSISAESTGSREAHELYLKGRYFWNKRSKSQVLRAIDYFQQAISKDLHYGLAYSGLADSYSLLGMMTPNPRTLYAKAAEAALESVRLNPRCAEAHTSVALVHFCNWRFSEAAAEFQKAIALDPTYPTAHHWYGLCLRDIGQTAEGLRELELAHQLDPVSLQIEFALANAYRKDGNYQEAEKHFLEIVRFDPSFRRVDVGLALLYANEHRLPENLAAHLSSAPRDDFPEVSEHVAAGLYMAGRKKQALELMTHVAQEINIGNQCFPFLLAAMGEKERSINCFEKGLEEKAGFITQIKTDPMLRELRGDPRFLNLLARVGFPSDEAAAGR